MSDLPPPQVASPFAVPAVAAAALAEIWRNLWPWDDLQAKLPPQRYLELGVDIMPVLAALTAMGPAGPKLLQSDVHGRLATASLPMFVDHVNTANVAGDTFITPAAISQYERGQWVLLGRTLDENNPLGRGMLAQVADVGATQITIDEPLIDSLAVGDPIVLIPPPVRGLVSVQNRPYSWSMNASATAPSIASKSQIVGLPLFPVLEELNVSLIGGGTAGNARVNLRDGGSGAGTVIWTDVLSVTAVAGSVDRVMLSGLGYKGDTTGTLTLEFGSAGPAGSFQTINAAGHERYSKFIP